MTPRQELKKYVKDNIEYYRNSLKADYNQPDKQAPEFINYLGGKLHAYQNMLIVMEDLGL